MEPSPRTDTRSAAILAAIKRAIEERRTLLDNAEDLTSITIEVKLQSESSVVRGITVTDERFNLPRRRR